MKSSLIYPCDATIAHPPHFENFPREVESLQEFRLNVERLRELGHRDALIRLYTRSGKHEVTQTTKWIRWSGFFLTVIRGRASW